MIEVIISHTGKSYSPHASWQKSGEETWQFPDMAEARKWLAETYGKRKRAPMFRDTKGGESVKVGYVIGYRDADYSHSPVNHWLAQDWIELRAVTYSRVPL